MTDINDSIRKAVAELIEKGSTKDIIEGYLLFNGVSKKEALAYLKEIGLIGKVSFRSWLHSSLKAGYVSPEILDKKILSESQNVRNHSSVYHRERRLANEIRGQFDPAVAELIKNEFSAKGFSGQEEEKASKKYTHPNRPKTRAGLYNRLIALTHPDRNGDCPELLAFAKRINVAKDNPYKLDVLWDEVKAYYEAKNS